MDSRTQRRQHGKRAKVIAGFSFLAATTAFTGYSQILRAPGAYAIGGTCQVTDSGDGSGAGTLRKCIVDMNALSGGGTITFSPSVTTLSPATPFPTLTKNITIDGGGTVTIDGTGRNATGVFAISGGSPTITGLTVRNFTNLTSGAVNDTDTTARSSDLLTVSNSTFTGNVSTNDGGAVHSNVATTISGSHFTSNSVTGRGGAAYVSSGYASLYALTISGSSFTDNTSASYGGAVFARAQSTITNTTFTHNQSTLAYGGAISVWARAGFSGTYGDVNLSGVTFTNNSANGAGGGLNIFYGRNVSVTGSTFMNNSSLASSGGGIAAGNLQAEFSISGSTFTDNHARRGGGIFFDGTGAGDLSPWSIVNSTFTDNSTSSAYGTNGGAIYVGNYMYGAGAITNSYIAGNSAQNGAAVILNPHSAAGVTMSFDTILGNTTSGIGAADVARVDADALAVLMLKGTVLSSTGTACNIPVTSDTFAVATDSSCNLTGTGSVQNAGSQLSWAAASTQVVNGVTQRFRPANDSSLLVTGAPTGALGTGVTTDQVGNARSGKFTIGSYQPPAIPGGGGSGGGTTPTPTPSSSASAATSAPVIPTGQAAANALNPALNPAYFTIPAGGLAPSASQLMLNGVPATVTVTPSNASSLHISGPGFTMQLAGLGAGGAPLGLAPDGALILEANRTAAMSGTGFAPDSDVAFYGYSTPRLIGTAHTDSSGSFNTRVPLPVGIDAGAHTLQANGFTPTGQIRSLSLGVIVRAPKTANTKLVKSSTVVRFNALSAALTSTAKTQLSRLVERAGRNADATIIRGYVQDSGSAANNATLSAARAASVATYLREIGLKGRFTVNGLKQPVGTTVLSRAVSVTIWAPKR